MIIFLHLCGNCLACKTLIRFDDNLFRGQYRISKKHKLFCHFETSKFSDLTEQSNYTLTFMFNASMYIDSKTSMCNASMHNDAKLLCSMPECKRVLVGMCRESPIFYY